VILKPSSDTCSCLVIVNWASKQQYVVVVSRHLIVGLRLQDKCQFLNHAKNKVFFGLVAIRFGFSKQYQPAFTLSPQSIKLVPNLQ
jgi:hypothetical protein